MVSSPSLLPKSSSLLSALFSVIFISLLASSSSSSFVSATTFNTCGLDNKLEVINYNAPTDPLYFENMHNCDVIIKSSKASLILFRAPSGSNDPISNLSVTIDDFVCADPSNTQSCIRFIKPLVNARNITIINVKQNIDIAGMTSVLSVVRFYGTVSYSSDQNNNNNNNHFVISNIFMSGTVRRTGALIINAVRFDDIRTIISNASSITLQNIRVSDFNEVVSTGNTVEVTAIHLGKGKIELVPKVIFRDIFINNINLIRSEPSSVDVSAIYSESESFSGLSDCVTSNSELKNNINNNFQNDNNKDLFFSSLECGFVVDNVSIHDIREVSSGSNSDTITITAVNWHSSIRYFQIAFFTNIHLRRIKINHNHPTTTLNPEVQLRGLHIVIIYPSPSFFGTDLAQNSVSNSILKFSNVAISDGIVLNRERSIVTARALYVSADTTSLATCRYFNEVEISNIIVGDGIQIYGHGNQRRSAFLGSILSGVVFSGCTNVANDPLMITEDNADLRTCSFLVQNISVANIFQELANEAAEEDSVKVTGVFFNANVKITAFDLVSISNVAVENLPSLMTEEIYAIELGGFFADMAFSGVSGNEATNDQLKSKFIIQNVIVRNVSLFLFSGSTVDLAQLYAVLFVRNPSVERFLSVSISQLVVQDVALYNDKTDGGFSVAAVSKRGDFTAAREENSNLIIDDIHVRNVTKNAQFRVNDALQFRNFKVYGLDHIEGGIEDFQHFKVSNITLQSINTSKTTMANFEEIIICAVEIESESSVSQFQYGSAGPDQSTFLVENIFLRDLYLDAAQTNTIGGFDRRVNAMKTGIPFVGYGNFTIQNLGIVGNIHLHLDQVIVEAQVLRMLSESEVSAQGQASSSEDSSFTVRNICFHPYSYSSSSPSPTPPSCDQNHHPQLGFPLSESSVSSPVPELLESIIQEESNIRAGDFSLPKLSFKSRFLKLYVVHIEGRIRYFATNVIENIQAHHIRSEPSDSSLSSVTVALANFLSFSGRTVTSPPDSFSRFTVRNLHFFDINVIEYSGRIMLYGFHTEFQGTRAAVANFNKILVENIIIEKVNLTNVQTPSSVEIRVCQFDTASITARDIATDSVTTDSFNSFIQRNFFLLNSHIYSENGEASIITHQVRSIGNFDQFFMGRSVVEHVTMIGETRESYMRMMQLSRVKMFSNRGAYSRIPGFRKALECSMVFLNNIRFSGEAQTATLVYFFTGDREEMDIFNVSHFYTNNFTISARREAAFAALKVLPEIVKAYFIPPPDGSPRVFTVNNIHSKNLHMISDDASTDTSDSERKVSIVNGFEGVAGRDPLVISEFDIFDFSDSSMINCSCRQTGPSPRSGINYLNYVSFVHFDGTGSINGETGSQVHFVNFHAKNVHLVSPSMNSVAFRVVNLVRQASNNMEITTFERMVFDNISVDHCSVTGTTQAAAARHQDDAAELMILWCRFPIDARTGVGSSFEMKHLEITNSHVSASKLSRLVVLWHPLQGIGVETFLFENIRVHNNTVRNSIEDNNNNPNSLVAPYADSQSHLYVLYSSSNIQSVATGGRFLCVNFSVVGNTVSVTRDAYLLVFELKTIRDFFTFRAQSIVLKDSKMTTTGNSKFGLLHLNDVGNDRISNPDVETMVSSLLMVDSLLAENNSLEIVKPNNDANPSTDFQNYFYGVRFNNLQTFAHIVWTNIHVSSLHIKAPENVEADAVTNTLFFFAVDRRLVSPVNDLFANIAAGSVEYYNNSLTIENISLQHYRLDYSPSLQGRHSIYGIELKGYEWPYCHVSVKNILFNNITSVSSLSTSSPEAATGGVQLEPIIHFPYSLDAPSHPTTATLTSASSYSASLTEQEKLEMAFCSLVFSNITLDKFNSSLKVRQQLDSFQIRGIQVSDGYIYGFSSITISDIAFSSIFISNVVDTISASPKIGVVTLFDAGNGIMFDQSYDTRNGVFPTVREEDRRLRITNLKIDGLSIAESEGFSIHVSCLSLGKEDSTNPAVANFHSLLMSNFSASSVSLVGSKSTSTTTVSNENNNNVFAQDLSCGLALVFLRGRLYRSLTGTTSTNGSMVVENFALEKKISVSSKPSSAFILGFAATKTDQDLVGGFNSVIFRNFSTSPLAFLDILSSQRSALFAHLFVRSPVSSSTTTSSSPSSLSILDFSVSSTAQLTMNSQKEVVKMNLVSINQSISGFRNVTLQNLHFSPSSVSSVTYLGDNIFSASAVEINGRIEARGSPTSFLKISNISFGLRESVSTSFIIGKTSIQIDALRIGGWKTADSNSVIIEDISLALSSSLLILGATERKMYSAVTITENQGMTSPKTTFSNISVLFVPSSPTISERISNINFEHSPLDPRTFATVQEIMIKNCTLNVLDSSSSNSLRTASVLSFASTDSRVSGTWNLVGNLVNSSSNKTSLISFVSSSSLDNNQIYDVTAKTSFTFLENDIEQSGTTLEESLGNPKIMGFVGTNNKQPMSSSSFSTIDFKNTEFHFKCNHWSRSYENDFETIMMDENIIQNARLYHECRTTSISLSIHPNSSTPSASFGETPTRHRTSLSASLSIIPTVSQSENASATSSNSETLTDPLPPPTLLRDFLNAATKTAGVSLSLFAGAHNAINTRKILAISSTADCGKKSAEDEEQALEAGPEANPLSLRIGSGSSKFASLRGVVLGGFAILLIWAIVMVGFALARQRVDPKQPCSFSRALYKVTMPGTLWVPASSMFPVAVNSCVVIAKRFEGEVIDIVMMIIGFAVAGAATVCVLFWIKKRVEKHEILLPEGVEEDQIEEYLENIENGGKKKQDEKEKGLLALFKNLADDGDSDKKKKKRNTTDEEDDSRSKEKDKKKKTSKTKNNNNIDYTALLFAKLVVIFDWLTAPKRQYVKTKFLQRFEPMFNWTAVLYYIPLSYISVLVMEIVEANTTLCSKNDRSCCEGGIVTMCVFAGIDLMLIILMKNPFLVPIDRYLFPVTSVLSFVSSILITIQFYDATSSLSVDGEDMRPESERIDFLDALVLLSQAAFIISMINCCFNGLAEFKNGYCSFQEAKEKKKLKEQRARQKIAQEKKELAEKKKREKLEAAEQEMKVIEKKKKYEEEGLKKGASRRYMALLDDEELELINEQEAPQSNYDPRNTADNDRSLLLMSPRSASGPELKAGTENKSRSKGKRKRK